MCLVSVELLEPLEDDFLYLLSKICLSEHCVPAAKYKFPLCKLQREWVL